MRPLILAVAILALAFPAFAEGPTALFLLIYRQGPAWKAELPMSKQPAIAAHGAYMTKLFKNGVTFAAGPMTDTTGGLAIIRAKSLDEARALAAADPGVSSGMFAIEVHAWAPAFRSDLPLPKNK